MTAADTGFWVADYSAKGKKWINPLTAHFLNGRTSPMGYNYAAFAEAQPGTVNFEEMQKLTSSFWPAGCVPAKS